MKTPKIVLAFLLLSCSLFAQTVNDPVIMTINGKPILKSEFEYIYNKNNSANSIDKKTLDEYVDLFINFKLKVEEAKSQGLDTTASFKSEYSNYRSQLVKPLLKDTEAEKNILKEAYSRMQEEVELSHIYVRMPYSPTDADTLAAYTKITDAYKRLKKEKFEKVAKISDDRSSADKGGYLGWSTAFIYMYPYENAMYNTPVGSYSKPFRTQAGYHIVKVHDRHPSRGEVLVAHIANYVENENMDNAVKQKMDSVYQAAKAGEDFSELAKKYSQDSNTAMRGGAMPWMTVGRMPNEYEKVVFSLQPGEVSQPFKTVGGWYIVKLLDKRDIPAFEDIESEIDRKVKYDERSFAGRDSLVAKLKREYNFQLNDNAVADFIVALKDKKLNDSTYIIETSGLNKPLFSFADKSYSQADFASFLQSNSYTRKNIASDIINEKLHEMITEKILAYEDTQMEKKDDNIRFLSQEYYDGILMFEISNSEVWEKASKDTLGLTKFFEERKNDYLWDAPHYKGWVVYAKDKNKLKAAKNILKKSPANLVERELKSLNDSVQYIKYSKGLFVKGENKVVDEKIFKIKGEKYQDEDFPYVHVQGKNLNYTPESYTDVRGKLTADYQNYLEQEWIKSLREKYPFSVNQEVLKTVKKN